MKSTIALLGVHEALADVLVLVQLTLLDGLINANNILPDNTTGANVQVADFTVSHETLGKTDCQRAGFQFGVTLSDLGALLCKLVHPWCLSVQDCVSLGG